MGRSYPLLHPVTPIGVHAPAEGVRVAELPFHPCGQLCWSGESEGPHEVDDCSERRGVDVEALEGARAVRLPA